MSGINQALRGGEFTFRVDDLRTLLAFCFGLLGHRAHHAFRQIDLLHFDIRDLHAPWIGVRVEDRLKAKVDLLAMGKKFVEFDQIAGLLIYLASDAGASVNGAGLQIDGGWTAA